VPKVGVDTATGAYKLIPKSPRRNETVKGVLNVPASPFVLRDAVVALHKGEVTVRELPRKFSGVVPSQVVALSERIDKTLREDVDHHEVHRASSQLTGVHPGVMPYSAKEATSAQISYMLGEKTGRVCWTEFGVPVPTLKKRAQAVDTQLGGVDERRRLAKGTEADRQQIVHACETLRMTPGPVPLLLPAESSLLVHHAEELLKVGLGLTKDQFAAKGRELCHAKGKELLAHSTDDQERAFGKRLLEHKGSKSWVNRTLKQEETDGKTVVMVKTSAISLKRAAAVSRCLRLDLDLLYI
jgi:hypothetical protein